MATNTLVEIWRRHQAEFKEAGVISLKLFESVLPDDAGPDGELKIVVESSRPLGLMDSVRLNKRLTELLGRPVSLITADTVNRRCFGVC